MIGPFFGIYRWLSNYWPAQVLYGGISYPSVEHAYQAAKSTDPGHRRRIQQMLTAANAKSLARTFPLRPDWDQLKLGIMRELLKQKFQIPELRDRLIATGNEELVELNTWNDTYWGVCRGVGHNHLGHLLMTIRKELTSLPSDICS